MLGLVLLASTLASDVPKTEMKVSPLEIHADWSLPWEEISGIKLHKEEVLVASDSALDLGRYPWKLSEDGVNRIDVVAGGKRTLVLAGVNDGKKKKKKAKKQKKSQWEAVTVDKGGKIFLLRETKDDIAVYSTSGEAKGRLKLGEFSGRTHKEKGYEGILLLRNGHVLVALTKPSMLVEFGPKGAKPLGLSSKSLLEGDFEVSGELALEPLSSWKLGNESGCEFSDLAVRGSLAYALLKDCNRIIQLPELEASMDSVQAVQSWSLPSSISHPEGLEALGDEGFLVASDVRAIEKNLFWLRTAKAAPVK